MGRPELGESSKSRILENTDPRVGLIHGAMEGLRKLNFEAGFLNLEAVILDLSEIIERHTKVLDDMQTAAGYREMETRLE